MTPLVDLPLVSRVFRQLLEHDDRPVTYACAGSKQTVFYSADGAAAVTGLLPAFLVTAEAIWTEAAGRDFGLEVSTEVESVLGFRITAIRHGTFSTVMLCLMETIGQISDPDRLNVNDLVHIRHRALAGRALTVAAAAGAGV